MNNTAKYSIIIHMPFEPGRVFTVCGLEAAWDAYRAAKEFGEIIGADNVMLIDMEAAEIIADVFDD